MIKRRILSGIAALLVLAASVAHASDRPVQLHFAFSAANELERDWLLRWTKRFNEENAGRVHVATIPAQWHGYGTHDAYVRFLSLQDPAVDIFRVDLPWVPEFADPGWLMPLDPALGEPFTPAARAGGIYRDTLYALPISFKTNLLFYRTDLVAEPPATLAELRRLVERRPAAMPIGIALHGLYTYNDFLPILWSAGGDPLALDSAAAIEAARQFAELTHSGAMPRDLLRSERWTSDYYAPFDAFAAGRAMFLVAWTADIGRLSRSSVGEHLGTARIPGVSGPSPANLGSYYLAVSAASRQPEAAVEFIRMLTSEEAELDHAETLGEVPARSSLAAEHPLYPLMTGARSRPRVPNEREVGSILETALHAVIDEKSPPEAAMVVAARRIRAARVEPLPPPVNAGPGAIAPPTESRWQGLPAVFFGVGGLLLACLILLLVVRHRLRKPLLTTLASKLILSGVTGILVLMFVSVGLLTWHALLEQEQEAAGVDAALRRQMLTHATTLGKDLALSASVLAEADRESGMAQLMMAGHFSEELLFLQVVDRTGKVIHSERDALYVDGAGGGGPAAQTWAPPADLVARIAGRRTVVEVRTQGSGVEATWVEVLVPAFARGQHLGALRLGVSTRRLVEQRTRTHKRHEAAIERILTVAGLVTTGLLILGTLAILLLSQQLSRPVVELTAQAQRIRGGDLTVDIVPRTSDEIGTLAGAMGEMVVGLRDRDFIRDTLGRYVTEEVARKFMEDPGSLELGGQLQHVTILMSDLRGFTALSERLGPQAMVALLNRYLERMTDVIFAHQGTINEFIGDAILALFGAPESAPDDALRAARCAIAMQRALDGFNAENAETPEDAGVPRIPRLAMGIGLNSGTVIAGNIGSQKRAKYGVVGEAVNLAARVESFTVGSQVLLSENTCALIRADVEVGPPVEVQVKGSAKPIALYELRAVGDLRMPVPPPTGAAPADAPAQVWRIDGKEVAAVAEEARVVGVGEQTLWLALEPAPARHDNLKLRVDTAAGTDAEPRMTADLYAKVVGVPDPAGAVELHLTSASEADLRALADMVR